MPATRPRGQVLAGARRARSGCPGRLPVIRHVIAGLLIICGGAGPGLTCFLPTPWSLRETDLGGFVARGGKLDARC
jgi:hypothetical protein